MEVVFCLNENHEKWYCRYCVTLSKWSSTLLEFPVIMQSRKFPLLGMFLSADQRNQLSDQEETSESHSGDGYKHE